MFAAGGSWSNRDFRQQSTTRSSTSRGLALGNVLGSIDRTSEGCDCRPIQNISLRIKARTVAGAIPAPFGGIPSHDAAQVRTHRRHLMHFTGFVTIDRELREALTEHGTC